MELDPALSQANEIEGMERLRFRRAPLLAAAGWMACGIGLAHWVWEPGLVLVAAASLLALLGVLALWRAPRVGWLAIAGLWVVVGLAGAEWRAPIAGAGGLAGYSDGLSRTVHGTVTRVRVLPAAPSKDVDQVPFWEASEIGPGSGDAGVGATSVDLAVDQVERVTPDLAEMTAATGGLRVTLYGAGPVLRCGDLVEVELRLKRLERYRDPGVWQVADWMAGQGIEGRANATAALVRRVGVGAQSWGCRLGAAQSWASGRLAGFVGSVANRGLPKEIRLTPDDAGMLDAMLFGDRTGLDHRLRVGFERTGTFHLFVVSGLHVALLAAAVFWAMRRLGAPDWVATGLTLATAVGYAAMTGLGAPVQRSLAMVAVFLGARLLARGRNSLNALGAAGLAMLLWRPESLFEAGFQMTVLAVVAIAGLAVPLAERSVLRFGPAARGVFRPWRRGEGTAEAAEFRFWLEVWGETLAEASGVRWMREVPARVVRGLSVALELLLMGVVTEMVMVLPMALYFHRATVFALPANMAVLPVVGVLAPAGVATFVGAVMNPWVALAPGALTAGLLHGVTWVVAHLGRTQDAEVRVPGPALWVVGVSLGCWSLGCWAARRSGWGAVATAVMLPAVAMLVLWPEPAVRTAGRLEVTAIDVGQGDSELVVGPGGRTMLVDAGGPIGSHGTGEVVSRFDVGEEVVSPYLWSRRVRRLDVVVLTHAHTDHMGGMPAVLENFRPRELWISGTEPDSELYRELLAEAARLGVTVRRMRAGEALDWGGVGVRVLSPGAGYRNGFAPRNDDSLVLELRYGKAGVLLEGDAERASEEAMVAAGLVRPVTLLKVGHHGSGTSSTAAFLAAARPQDAVVSVGRGNSFGHPKGDVVDRFGGLGVRLYRTDEMGLSSFLLSPDGGIVASAGEWNAGGAVGLR